MDSTFHRFKECLVIVFLMCCRSSQGTVEISETRTYATEVVIPSKAQYFYVTDDLFPSFNDSNLYAFCEEDPAKLVTCTVALDVPLFSNTTSRYTCAKIKLSPDDENSQLLSYFTRLWPLADKRVMIGYSHEDDKKRFVGYKIVDMANCSIVDLIYSIENDSTVRYVHPIIYPNKFEVILSNKQMCRDGSVCRLTYDFGGTKIGEPQPFQPQFNYLVFPVNNLSPQKGYYVQNITDFFHKSPWIVMHVNAAGVISKEMSVEHDLNIFHDKIAYSNARELLSYCGMPYNSSKGSFHKIQCIQFDTNGEKVNAILELEKPMTWLAIHNLADADIAVATGHCEDRSVKVFCQNFYVRKLSADGWRDEYLMISGIDLECSLFRNNNTSIKARISENDKDELCFHFACAYKNEETSTSINFRHITKCIPSNLLSTK